MKTYITLLIGCLSLTEATAENPNPEKKQTISAEVLAFEKAQDQMFEKATFNAKSKYVFVTDPRS